MNLFKIILLLFFTNIAQASSLSGVYDIFEKFSDGSALKGQITYDSTSNCITSASLQLSNLTWKVSFSSPYYVRAHQTEDGFAQKIISFEPQGEVSVTLVLNTNLSSPQFDMTSDVEGGNSYSDKSAGILREGKITKNLNVNKITLVSATPASIASLE